MNKIIISLVSVIIVAIAGIMLYAYWPAITGTIDGSKYYTSEDLQEAYDKGYSDGNKNETEQNAKLEYYKQLVDDYYSEVNTLNKEIEKISKDNADKDTSIKNLEQIKSKNLATIEELNNLKTQNEQTIASLNQDKKTLQEQISQKTNELASANSQINSKSEQIATLQSEKEQLEAQLVEKQNSIKTLNNQIASLNTDISNLENDKAKLVDRISALNEEIESLNSNSDIDKATIASLNSQIATLNDEKEALEYDKVKLNEKISSLNIQIDELNSEILSQKSTITSLNGDISTLTAEKTALMNDKTSLQNTINSLNSQLTNLQNLYTALQATNQSHIQTISVLNTQIATLNSQISNLTYQQSSNQNNIKSLNDRIAELEKSVAYYEQYISQLEKDNEQVVATFEFDGSVYNIQIVNKGSKVSVVNPTSTAYKIFNGWKVDNETVDLDTYTITVNTKFVADVTYKYDVKFMDEETVVKSDIIVKDGFATLPTTPTKAGYEFDGWSINGVDIVDNITTTPVTANTIYKAVWTKLILVTFMYDGEVKSTQTIHQGESVTIPEIESTAYKIFNYWTINGIAVDVSAYTFTEDTVITANITYKYDVKFVSENEELSSEIVEKGLLATAPATNPTTTREHYVFAGWSADGTELVDVLNYPINENTTFTAIFELEKFTVTFTVDGVLYDSQKIPYGSTATLPAVPVKENFLFKGWKSFFSLIDVDTYQITANIELYAAFESIFKMNIYKNSKAFFNDTDPVTNGAYFWDSQSNNYYSCGELQFVYDSSCDSWTEITWNGLNVLYGQHVWKTADSVYYSFGSSQYRLDEASQTWVPVIWNGLNKFYGECIWSDGNNFYYSSSDFLNCHGKYQYVLDQETNTWSEITWNGCDNFDGSCIWKMGNEIYLSEICYLSAGASPTSLQYKLDKDSRTWIPMPWNGFSDLSAKDIFFIDNNIFYSSYSGSKVFYYIFDFSEFSWKEITWDFGSTLGTYKFWGANVFYVNGEYYVKFEFSFMGTSYGYAKVDLSFVNYLNREDN